MQITKPSNPTAFKSVIAGRFVRSLISEGFSREPYHLPLSEISSYPHLSVLKNAELKKVDVEIERIAPGDGFLNMIFSGNISKA
ncbi:MAG TPA: hypothetical protein VFG10_15330 [Saprospiraceae bacterium]|nr:hypothetical protein [Saprospiraceae bacterium]